MSSARFPVAILLATYNGGRFLGAQLESLARQQHADWRLVVSDDGSTDDSRNIVDRFAAGNPDRDITIIEGPRKGATANFLSLLSQVRPGEAVAFCDQDDVWLEDRLAIGVSELGGNTPNFGGIDRDEPALHVTRTIICDDDLRRLAPAPLYRRTPSFRNALVQACTPGNTMLVNPRGVEVLKAGAAAAMAANVISHDWWSYLLISGAGGTVIRDPRQTVLYRQHRGNVMGRNDTFAARLARLRGLGGGDYGRWLRHNAEALGAVPHLLTHRHRAELDRFTAAIDASGPVAAAQFVRLGLYRQTRAGTAALMAAAFAGRLRTGR